MAEKENEHIEAIIDEKEFNSIYRHYYAQLYYYAFGFVEDAEICRDILADVFERIWTSREKMKVKTIKNFLYSSTRNRCIDYIRHDQAAQQYADYLKQITETDDELTPEEREERINSLKMAVEKLPERTRYVLEECYFNHKKYREVAESLNISTNAIKLHIMKALSTLRENYLLLNHKISYPKQYDRGLA